MWAGEMPAPFESRDSMKKGQGLLLLLLASALLAGCSHSKANVTKIELSDEEIRVNGEKAYEGQPQEGKEPAVYVANDIIFYQEGQDVTYGEGADWEEHSQEEADAHQVVHITEPGKYELSGTLSQGQIFVDLGDNTKDDPKATVTLILNNADVTCTVAPALMVYRTYECGESDPKDAAKDVDTSHAGATILLADGSVNNFAGSHVARIYESVELNEDGTEVLDSKKLHKYDGAFYSRRSMNIYGDTGVLNVSADNEGIGTEMHLTIEGGNINIFSGNDGINVNEDEVSVFTMNGGKLNITVTGESGEGDGIDSNGWLVVNGGTITSAACGTSMDSGLDSDMGIYLNGGTIVSTGNMLDHIEAGGQPHALFTAQQRLSGGQTYTAKDSKENIIIEATPENDFQMLVVSADNMQENEAYTLWAGDTKVADSGEGGMMGMPGMPGGRPGGRPGGAPGEFGPPEGMEPPKKK